MELENINYLIGNANISNAISLNISLKELTFLLPYNPYGLENSEGFNIYLNQLALLPPEVSYLKNLTIINNSNSCQMVE